MKTLKPSLGKLAGAVMVLVLVLAMTGCAQIHREPLVHQPMTARLTPPVLPTAPSYGSIYQSSLTAQPLFEDRRPRSIGDTLTIIISESINASKNSAADASRTGSASATLGILPKLIGGLLSSDQNASVSGQNALAAKGAASAANTFNGVITVTVIEVLANGNLLVSGEKQMLINQGTEFVRFSGVVNPRQLGANSTVASTLVADARIEYSAKGYINEAQEMGWLQRFFLNVLPL